MSPPKYTALPTAPPVSSQPKAASMQLDEKSPAHTQCSSPQCTSHSHSHSQLDSEDDSRHNHHHPSINHNAVLRRILLPFLVALVVLCGVLAVGSCMSSGSEGVMGGLGELVGRAVGDGTNGTGQQGAFVHRKLYLIVVFVGLFVVLILAIMLSAWCCRGAFENPCCCPCYLCACCGGLACLECIGCGLCAEGVDQL